jgi:hypothetical protein
MQEWYYVLEYKYSLRLYNYLNYKYHYVWRREVIVGYNSVSQIIASSKRTRIEQKYSFRLICYTKMFPILDITNNTRDDSRFESIGRQESLICEIHRIVNQFYILKSVRLQCIEQT